MRKRLLETFIIEVFLFIFIYGIFYSCYNLFNREKNISENKKIKDKIEDSIIVNEEDDKTEVDFNSLRNQNQDVVAYIKVNNTKIDYVVVKSTDNEYYLTHNFNKESNIAGWVFADYRNNFDGNDKNIILYGHNMKDGSMFGTMKNILKNEWNENEDNLKISFITESGESMYEIFSVYTIVPEDYYINTDFVNDNEYEKFLNTIKSRTVYNYNVDVSVNDHILTLSTCTLNGTKRLVLHAKLINETD